MNLTSEDGKNVGAPALNSSSDEEATWLIVAVYDTASATSSSTPFTVKVWALSQFEESKVKNPGVTETYASDADAETCGIRFIFGEHVPDVIEVRKIRLGFLCN